MTDLPALLSRLEAAEGPDREIDHDIKRIVENDVTTFSLTRGFDPRNWRTHVGDKVCFDAPRYGPGGSTNDTYVDNYTSSLDAAIALAERALPGWRKSLMQHPRPDGSAFWQVGLDGPWGPGTGVSDDLGFAHGNAPTPALALCIAIVRALITQQKQRTPHD